jgi:glycosyltransferase involved in cell wall biosynthesis
VALAVEILRADAISYEQRRAVCLKIAAKFSWPEVAAATLRAYRRALGSDGDVVVFTHPFGLQSPSGGARIMRALLQASPFPFISVTTSPERPPPTNIGREVHLPLRPNFGRLERTRFAKFTAALAPFFADRFARKLEALCRQNRAGAIHAIAHGGMDFYTASLVAKKLGVPFFLQVHDDFIFTGLQVRNNPAAHSALRDAWTEAAARFVICSALGEEYCRRYGKRDYVVITDGVENIAVQPRQRTAGNLNVYFMGLFHLDYEPNLKLLLRTLAELKKDAGKVYLTLRCGGVRSSSIAGYEGFVSVLPFASEAVVESDMKQADLLYLPLPFEKNYELFARFSLSTKMVTYLGSGVPILYHGPSEAAVRDLLKAHNAALLCTRPGLEDLLTILRQYVRDPELGADLARNALALARSDFMLREIRTRFWNPISNQLAN